MLGELISRTRSGSGKQFQQYRLVAGRGARPGPAPLADGRWPASRRAGRSRRRSSASRSLAASRYRNAANRSRSWSVVASLRRAATSGRIAVPRCGYFPAEQRLLRWSLNQALQFFSSCRSRSVSAGGRTVPGSLAHRCNSASRVLGQRLGPPRSRACPPCARQSRSRFEALRRVSATARRRTPRHRARSQLGRHARQPPADSGLAQTIGFRGPQASHQPGNDSAIGRFRQSVRRPRRRTRPCGACRRHDEQLSAER